MFNLRKNILGLATAIMMCPFASAETTTISTPSNFQVLSISPNAKWACGIYVDAVMNSYAFRWNLEGGSIEVLSKDTSIAWDIANDGTVSGEFMDNRGDENAAARNLPGFWRDGAWHSLELPNGKISDGIGSGISPDGHYMVGSLNLNGKYTAIIWKDGSIERILPASSHAVPYAVSPDGGGAAGFAEQYNRTACYWAPDGSLVYFEDSDVSQSPWNSSRNFSPNGSKLLYWGGWDPEEDGDLYLYSIYDLNSGERSRLKAPSYDSDLELFDISDNGIIVGYDRGRGYVFEDGEGMYIDDFLAKHNVDLRDYDAFYKGTDYYAGQLPIYRMVAISADGKALAGQFYDTTGQPASVVIKLDQDYTIVTPAEVQASKLSGIPTVALKWKRPVGVASVRGYNVYRDGKKVNGMLPINVPYYYDRNIAPGTYQYEVSAVTVAGVETKCEPIAVVVTDNEAQAPYSLFARQKGMDRALIEWQQPLSNIAHKRYYDPNNTDYEGFSIYDPLQIEMAIAFDRTEMAAYSGHKISEVSFIPMAAHDSWAINLYTRDSNGSLSLLSSQPITQQLTYGTLNTVKLDNPVDVPNGDLIAAISIKVKQDVNRVLGAENGKVIPGQSDLLRQQDDEDFFSVYDSSVASGMYLTCLTWCIDLGLTPDNASAGIEPSHYNVFLNGEKVCDTNDTSIVLDNMESGSHTVAVEAQYQDGTISERLTTKISINADGLSVTDLNVTPDPEVGTAINASWEAPVDCDLTHITYSTANKHARGIKSNESNSYAMMVAAEYPAKMFRGYTGYQVRSFKFYPLCDAIFTFMLYADNELVYEYEVEDYNIGMWNEVVIPDVVTIEPNTTYRLAVDCFDPEPDVNLMAIDDDTPRSYASDLYSTDNGETWQSLTLETGTSGNWMIGMDIVDTETNDLDIEGYDVVIDNKVRNEARLTSTNFSFDFGKADPFNHNLRVDVYYNGKDKPVRSEAKTFRINGSGISTIEANNINLHQSNNYLIAEGEGIQALTIYAASGAEVAKAHGERVDISSLPSGVYFVYFLTSKGTVSQKVNINK